MKIALVSDVHLLGRTPMNRVDDILDYQWEKLDFILRTCLDRGVFHVMQAGDLFDVPRNWDTLNKTIQVFKNYNDDIYIGSVFGQHDTYMRNNHVITNKALLNQLDLLLIPDENHILYENEEVKVFGINFEDNLNIADLIDKFEFSINRKHALVIHAPISDTPAFQGHEFLNATLLLKKLKSFDLILCGDIHKKFKIQMNGRWIVNTGCIIRKNNDEYNQDYKPCFFIWDTDKRTVDEVQIPHNPSATIFNYTETLESKNVLNDFINSIIVPAEESTDIYSAIKKFIKDNNIDPAIENLISEVMIHEG
jgi:DNA repair exonuclease SbcCD nuclease subunit